jgi:MFS family permease
MHLPPALRPLRHRNYRLLFTGQLVAQCGFWMQATAQGWLVLRLTDSPLWLGAIAAAQSLPVLALSLLAGTVADRVPKRRVILASQSVAMLNSLVLAALTFSGLVQVWHVLLAALVIGVAASFENPARQSFTIELVGRDDLLGAIALDSLVLNGARIIGPGVAGAVAAAIGEGPAFLINGLSIVAVIAGLLMMHLTPAHAPPRTTGMRQLREGLNYMAEEPRVRLVIAQLCVLCVFGLAYIPLLPYFARNVLGGDALTFGMLASVNAFGAMTAALMITTLGDRLPRVRLRAIALLSYAIFLGGFTLARDLLPALILIGCVGWCGITSLTLSNTLLQIIVPDALRGRVMSVFVLLVMGVSQLSGLLLSLVAEWAGNVPLTVGVWVACGWCIQATLGALSGGIQLEAPRRPVQPAA